MQQLSEFYYLVSLITDDNKAIKKIKKRITLAKHVFAKKNTHFTDLNKISNMKFKKYIFIVFYYMILNVNNKQCCT